MLSQLLYLLTLLLATATFTTAQQPTESPPSFQWTSCYSNNACAPKTSKLVVDANYRRIYSTASYNANCFTGNYWNATLCPDNKTCARNCGIDVIRKEEYESEYGVKVSGGGSLKLKFNTKGTHRVGYGARLFLLGNEETYETFDLLDKELSFDIDASKLPCGLNGAVSLHLMDFDGQKSKFPNLDKAGARLGTGYCDAECPRDLHFINGQANNEGWKPSNLDPDKGAGAIGSCCPHISVFNGNSMSTSLSAHPCKATSQEMCDRSTGSKRSCASDQLCDAQGCDFNPYRMEQRDFYGLGKTIDTKKKFTVLTRFLSGERDGNETLATITRAYVQDSKTTQNPKPGDSLNIKESSLTPSYCNSRTLAFNERDSFTTNGGFQSLYQTMAKGMVLAISLTDDLESKNLWLDSKFPENSEEKRGVLRGACGKEYSRSDMDGWPIEAEMVISDLKIRELGSE